ncbi:MAG: hypothetical protein IPL67_11190 [Ignavibacteria bacterium]|nr:hypothetical protein [Ignavibacteria bacterium]
MIIKRLIITLLLIVVFIPIASSQQIDNWEWLHPKPQGNSLNAIDFVNDNIGYTAGAFGTILKTTDGGSYWNQLIPISNQSILSLDFTNTETGYAGSFNQKLSKTTDGGLSWNSLQLPVTGQFDSLYSILDIDFLNLNVGYVVGFFSLESKIWKTTDGGSTWTTQTTAGANYLNTLHFIDENNGYAAGGSLGSEIIKTTNGGSTWELVEFYNAPALYSLHFIDQTTGVAGGGDGRILISTNSGVNWNSAWCPSSMEINSLVFINSTTGFGFGSGDVYIKTTNGGLNWTEEEFGWTVNRLFSDASLTPNGTIHAAGNYGIVIRSTNSGANWQKPASVTENTLSEIRFVNNTTGYALCGYGGGDILKTTNSGQTWVSQISSYTTPMYGLSFTDSVTGYIAGSINLRKTTNGGTNWSNVYTSFTNEIFADIAFTNPNTGYAVGSYGKLQKTTNAGQSWTASTIPISGSFITAICFVNENTGYAVGDNSAIAKTTIAGVNWTTQTSPYGFAYNTSVDFVDVNTGYISSGSGLLRTTNGGTNWIAMNAPSGGYYKVQFRNNFGYAVNSNGKIIKSIDGGTTWIEQPTVTNNGLYALYFNTDNYVYAGGLIGTILKTIPTELLQVTRVDLTMFIEGFYNPSLNTQVRDTVRAYLRSASSPYARVDSAVAVMSENGVLSLRFSNASSGQYYITVKHRNSIETWSRAGGENITVGSTLNYNMSDQQNRAFGNNLKQIDNSPVRFAIFSGDVNQDGFVDGSDMSNIDNDAFNFVSGYVASDVNGDGTVDGSDGSITENNSFAFVGSIKP